MLLRDRLILPAVLLSVSVLTACGGSSNKPPVTPTPTGGFSNSNLSGSYVFSTTGTDAAGNFLTIMGVLAADGKGNITGGAIDENRTLPRNDIPTGNQVVRANITSGTYNVNVDGRPTGTSGNPTGLITLQTDTGGGFQFNYVLTSSGHGLVTEFEGFGSGSGTLDLQSTVTQADLNGQSYAFNLTGTAGFDNVLCHRAPGAFLLVSYATVGAFTLDASGNVSTGLEDSNNNCVASLSTNVQITGGAITLGQQGVGTATITTGTSPTAITYTFDVFPIDATHLKLIETDSFTASPLSVLVGDAFTQATSIPSGNSVFTVAGFDNAINVMGPFTAAGILHTDGSSTILPDSAEDINDVDHNASLISPANSSFSGTYTAVSSGRAELTLDNFVNGNDGAPCVPGCIFAAYPSSGGLQMLEIDDQGSTDGIAFPQSATSLASSNGFGMNLSGVAFGVSTHNAEDDIAQFSNNNGNFSGMIDFNDQGTLSFGNSFSETYAADATVPGRGTVTAVTNSVNLTTYVVDSSTAVAVSSTSTFVGLATLVQQSSTAKSNIVANHLAVMRVSNSARANSIAKKSPPIRAR